MPSRRFRAAMAQILNRDRPLAQPCDNMGAHRRRVIADNHHDPLATKAQRGIDGMVDHRPAANPVQHLGCRRFHSLALAGCENDGGPGGHLRILGR